MIKVAEGMEQIGSYGTFNLPVYLVDGEEHVAEEYFLGENSEPEQTVCQSAGCEYCEGDYTGCRHAPKNRGRATDWFI